MWADANATTYILVPSVVSRSLQEEEQQLRTSSLPAIPNPFPELCSPASSPVLSPGSLPPGEPPTDNYVSPIVTVVNYWGIHKTSKQFVFYLQGCLCGFNIFATHYNLVWLNLDAKHGPSMGLLFPLKNRMWDISRYWYTSVFMTVRVTPALHPSLWWNKSWMYTYVVANCLSAVQNMVEEFPAAIHLLVFCIWGTLIACMLYQRCECVHTRWLPALFKE